MKHSCVLLLIAACSPAAKEAPPSVPAPAMQVQIGPTATVAPPLPPVVPSTAEPATLSKESAWVVEQMKGWFRTRRPDKACQDFDYGTSGGLRTLYCHVPNLTMEALLAQGAPNIFLSGPHTTQGLNLSSSKDFGHYNPAFVDWMTAHVPAPKSAAQLASAPAFSKYGNLMKIMAATKSRLVSESACFEREKKEYVAATKAGKANQFLERWFYAMNPKFCTFKGNNAAREAALMSDGFDAGFNGNVTKTAIAFWMRRQMDGTFDNFAKFIDAVSASYGTLQGDAP